VAYILLYLLDLSNRVEFFVEVQPHCRFILQLGLFLLQRHIELKFGFS
jgi:hypothetical protein